MEPVIIVKPIDRGCRIDYVPLNDLGKLIAASSGAAPYVRRCLSQWQLDIWKEAGAKIIFDPMKA